MMLLRKIQKPRSSRKQRGLTLIELGLAIAISAAIIIVLLIALRAVDNSKNLMTASQTITQIWSAGSRYADSFSDISTLQKSGYLSKNIVNDPWGKPYTATGTATSVTITAPGLDTTVCGQLKSKWDKSTVNQTSTCSANKFTITFYNNAVSKAS